MQNAKILVLSHPLRDLGVTHMGHLWLDRKRIVDFLLATIERFSVDLTVEARRADIGRNRCVRKGVGHFERKFRVNGASLTNDCWRQKTRVPRYRMALFA